MRVVLEEEWTKARQGTEEVCCWGAQDKLCLDILQMSQFRGVLHFLWCFQFRSFLGLVGEISQGPKVMWFWGKNETEVKLGGSAGYGFLLL